MKMILDPAPRGACSRWKAGILAILGVFLVLAVAPAGRAAGTWVPLTHGAPRNAEHLVLLTDGTVLASDNTTGTGWFKLTPDSSGHYVNGTWSNLTAMSYSRYFFQSQVLTNGQLYVSGGEYGSDGQSAEVYDPVANSWTIVTPPDNVQSNSFVDALSILLPDGWVFIPPVYANSSGGTVFFNPATSTWSLGPRVATSSLDEASWVMLPDQSIIVDEAVSAGVTGAQRYLPGLNIWTNDTPPPVDLYSYNQELGPAFLLPNQKVIFFGGNTNNLIYTPSGSASPGTWAQATNYPNGQSMPDAPGAMMVNGKILLATSLAPYFNSTTTNLAPAPTSFYEYDYSTGPFGTFTQIPGPTATNSNTSQGYNLLDLPDGTVLLSHYQTTNLYIYQPDGSALAAGKPTIDSVSKNADGSLHLTGTQFNGISAGSSFGDDWQEDTDYPLVRFTDASGNVRYGRTYHWHGGVATGTSIVSTDCSLPSGASLNDSIQVVANGNASSSVHYPLYGGATVYVDYSYSGTQVGTQANPYNTIHTGVSQVPSGGIISIAGGHATSGGDGHILINTPVRITAHNGTASIGPN